MKKSQKGAVSFFVLLFILAALFFFQSYLSFTTADYNTGWDLDDHTQRITEEANLRIIVKQALLTYYERGYFTNQDASTVAQLINVQLGYLNTDNAVSYTLASTPALPSRDRSTFWPLLEADGTTSLGGSFNVSESSAARDFDHVNDFIPPASSAFEVRDDTDSNFNFVFNRAVNGVVDGAITVTARMWQVPVTDFNVFAYAYPIQEGIPAAPTALNSTVSSDLQNGTLRGVSLSDIGSIAGQPTTSYPFYYRELFSAGSQVWQYLFYSNGYYNQFMALTHESHNINSMADDGDVVHQLTYRDAGDDDIDAYWEISLNSFIGNLLITSSDPPSQPLYIVDNGSLSTSDPVIIYLYNRGNSAEIDVHLNSSYSRPMLIIGEKVNIILDADASISGGLLVEDYGSSNDLTVYGTFACNAVSSNLQNVIVNPYSDNPFQGNVPRFLLVDTF